MLVLGRKENETILIGDNIRITIVGRSGASVRIGVQAPNNVRILREEILIDGEPVSQAEAVPSELLNDDVGSNVAQIQ